MTPWNQGVWRIAIFGSVLLTLIVLEALLGGPNPAAHRRKRWLPNAALVGLDTLAARVLLPAGAVGAALWAQSREIGLFHALAWPAALEIILSLVVLDLAIYWQHRLFHSVSWLWPLHRVHHTDETLDASSALRFHPFEVLLSLGIKVGLTIALGITPLAVLIFEILLSSFALVTHANLALPPRLDALVRYLLVTPTMHRIHHSTRIDEQRTNFGFNLSVWDRLFRSYASQHREQELRIGVEGVAGDRSWRFLALLKEPFKRQPSP